MKQALKPFLTNTVLIASIAAALGAGKAPALRDESVFPGSPGVMVKGSVVIGRHELGSLCASLRKVSGLEVYADRRVAMRNVRTIAAMDRVSVPDYLTGIARATELFWKKAGDTYILSESPPSQEQLAKQAIGDELEVHNRGLVRFAQSVVPDLESVVRYEELAARRLSFDSLPARTRELIKKEFETRKYDLGIDRILEEEKALSQTPLQLDLHLALEVKHLRYGGSALVSSLAKPNFDDTSTNR